MIRFGIARYDQLPTEMPQHGTSPALSFALIGEFVEPLSPRDETAIEIIGDTMPTGQYLRNRSRTFPQRYDEVNELIAREIANQFPPGQPVRIHDMAIGNAITSLDLFEKLGSRPNLTCHATDLHDEIFVVSVPRSRWQVIFDNQRRPLQFVSKTFVLAASGKEPRKYPVNRFMQKALTLAVLPRARRCLASFLTSQIGDVQAIPTFHPRSVALARRDPRFTLGRSDMFEPQPGAWEVIRIMSAFAHLTASQVEQALQAICRSLVDGGILVVGRNLGRGVPEIPTTIFKRRSRRLLSLCDLSGGAEQKELALGLRFDADPPAAKEASTVV